MKKCLLIIDDDPISILILKKNLEIIAISQEIITFNNGKEAFNHLEKINLNNNKYVIFLDINMPVMNGWEFLNKVDRLITLQNTTIYLLTSSINKADMEKAKQFPLIKKYISKPICKDVLKEIKEKNKI